MNLRSRNLVDDRQGESTAAGAQVDHHGRLVRGKCGQYRVDKQFRLRTRDEHSGADQQIDVTKGSPPADVLQRFACRTALDQSCELLRRGVGHLVNERQPRSLDAEAVCEQDFGVDPRRGNPGGAQPLGRGVEQAAAAARAHDASEPASIASTSARDNASITSSRAPSIT